MKAMLLESLGEVGPHQTPLRLTKHPEPTLAPGEVLVKVSRCGVCHTELDEIEGRTPPPRLPVILGHQVVGTVIGVQRLETLDTGQRVGIAWIASACGECEFCKSGQENLCSQFKATGRDIDGG